jgi:hypothetical protein
VGLLVLRFTAVLVWSIGAAMLDRRKQTGSTAATPPFYPYADELTACNRPKLEELAKKAPDRIQLVKQQIEQQQQRQE